MAVKWTGSQSESGILRKNEFKEKKEELFVFGYSCKLFRDDDKALHIDQGKHLIPWMGDETLKIDRYDARGALHELRAHEAPPGGFDWRVELTRAERDVEQLCDEERYRALHTDEDEEEMYKEEELKRLHAAGYGQVGFNYDAPAQSEPVAQPAEVDEPFLPTQAFRALLPADIVIPETEKQNVIIEKTAKFIAEKGVQVEILIKAKQGENPQFEFLNRDSTLHPYYTALIGLVKAGKWPEKQPEVVEEKPPENEDYLHPSLAYSTIIESAPSIPSIQYKPSADCDYTLLVSRLRGSRGGEEAGGEEPPHLAPGEVAPPGTEPLPPRPHPHPHPHPHIQRAPVLYSRTEPPLEAAEPSAVYQQQYAAYYHQYMAQNQPPPPPPLQPEPKGPLKSTGLSLMKNYNTDSDSDVSDCDDTSSTDSKGPPIPKPPEEIQVVVEKMASYVARNGAEFADIVRAKGDPRFSFLEPSDQYHAYYCSRLAQLRNDRPTRANAPVSFSIKKVKEPDPILPKPALPYESSSDEESEKDKQTDKQNDKPADKQHNIPNKNTPNINVTNNIPPPVVVYKIQGTKENNIPIIKNTEIIKPKPVVVTTTVATEIKKVFEEKSVKTSQAKKETRSPPKEEKEIKKNDIRKSATPEKVEKRRKESPRVPERDRKERVRKYEKSESREKRSREKEKKRERVKKRRYSKEKLETEIISLEDNSDEMIDLTEDLSDSKVSVVPVAEGAAERQKQRERRRRAAEFLQRVGVDPGAAAALPTSSLASAMVDTLESLRKKKAEAEEKRRKRDKRRHRPKHGYEDDGDKSHRKSKRRKHKSSDEEDSDYEDSKKKKRKKDKKPKNKKKRRREVEEDSEEEVDHPLPPNIDLTTTLKELRTSSPTKHLVLQDVEERSAKMESSSAEEEEVKMKKKKDREYSEGEWSSDSVEDSGSSPSKNGD